MQAGSATPCIREVFRPWCIQSGNVGLMQTSTPANQTELAAVLAEANESGLGVIPAGGCTKSAWGNPPRRADIVLSTTHLNQVIEHAWADLTVSVEAGCTIGKLQKVLSSRGQRLAADPAWPEQATVGGVLSTNDTGALRLCFGGLRDLVIGITLALPNGTLAVSGGKVVKNVAGYDLPKLVIGALGTLGVITQAVFRVHPLPRHSKTLTFAFANLEAMQRFILSIQNAGLSHTALQLRVGNFIEADILLEGTEAGIASQERFISEIASPADCAADVWNARQRLLSESGVLAKVSVLPSEIGDVIAELRRASTCRVVMQAHGLGFVFMPEPGPLLPLRASFESRGGSLVILRQPNQIEVWGDAGSALPLMVAVKQRFDPKGILNPGRYLGGI